MSQADPDAARLARLFYDRVTDITVNGHPAFVGGFDDRPAHRAVVWTAGSRTVMLGGTDFTDDEMIAIAESLRSPTEGEWSAMTAPTPADTSSEAVATTVPA